MTTVRSYGQCPSCKAFCQLIGPFWQAACFNDDPILFPHYHCLRCGTTRVPVGRDPNGRESHLSAVNRDRFRGVAA